jgi:integrase
MPRKPSAVTVGPLHARAVRGPRADGRWYWRARRYVDGNEDSPWVGWATRDELQRILAGLIASDVLDAPRSDFEDVKTVRDLLECWVASREAREDLAAGTVANYRTKARHLADGLGDARLDRLDVVTLEAYRDRRLRGRAAGASVAMELNVLRIAWAWGREVGACPARALPKLDVRAKAVRNHHTPAPDDVRAVAAQLEGWARAVFVLLYATGARIGEVADLEWSAFDLARGIVTLRGKTGVRVVPLAPEALAAVSAFPHREGRVFPVASKTVRVTFPRYIARACVEAGVPVFPPHGLRRAAVDRFARAGVDVGTAAAFLGHSPAVMLQHYRGVNMDDLRHALAASRLGTLDGGQVVELSRVRRR